MTGAQSNKLSAVRPLLVLCTTMVIHIFVQTCPFVTGSTYDKFGSYRLTTRRIRTDSVSVIACCRECSMYNWCRILSYQWSSGKCQLSDISCKNVAKNSEINSDWVTFVTNYTACITPLVSGPGGIGDSQLTASSNKNGHPATYARLNLTDYYQASWSPRYIRVTEYVQAAFVYAKAIAAIMLQGGHTKHPATQWVVRFEVAISLDCKRFAYVEDKSGNKEVFDGNSSPEEIVTRYLREWIIARCIRLHPTAFVRWPSLRFDILGC